MTNLLLYIPTVNVYIFYFFPRIHELKISIIDTAYDSQLVRKH